MLCAQMLQVVHGLTCADGIFHPSCAMVVGQDSSCVFDSWELRDVWEARLASCSYPVGGQAGTTVRVPRIDVTALVLWSPRQLTRNIGGRAVRCRMPTGTVSKTPCSDAQVEHDSRSCPAQQQLHHAAMGTAIVGQQWDRMLIFPPLPEEASAVHLSMPRVGSHPINRVRFVCDVHRVLASVRMSDSLRTNA